MCGIVAMVQKGHVNQLLYDALLLLQHRGQDAAGIATQMDRKFFMYKAKGMVRDVFRTRNMRALPGNCGLGQVRYPTAGNAYSEEEAQPFYVNAPFGIVMVHNGNLTNAQALRKDLAETDHRHINTESDSEVLLNVLAHELGRASNGQKASIADIFTAVRAVHRRLRGSYAVIAMIAGHGLLAFRDPFGIRPLCMGHSADGMAMFASESVALEGLGVPFDRDVAPGEAVFVDLQGKITTQQCAERPVLNPCLFEYVYLARPDTKIAGRPVQPTRVQIGRQLAIEYPVEADLVIPVPESGTPAALGYARESGIPFGMGLVKNSYVGRTFIQPSQTIRQLGIRLKLNPLREVIAGKRLVVVDDSIVRGNTQRALIRMLREAGAREVHVRISSPPVEWPCFYGIDFATRAELIAPGLSTEEIAQAIEADSLGYVSLAGLHMSVGLDASQLCSACFDGKYPIHIPHGAAAALGIDQENA